MTDELKNELIDFVLSRTSLRVFNQAIKEYSVQAIYAKCKFDLKRVYPELMPSDLHYSVKMSEAFEQFKIPEIKLKDMAFEMRRLRRRAVSRHKSMAEKAPLKKQYNDMVREWNQLIQPQQKLIKRWKKVNGKSALKN